MRQLEGALGLGILLPSLLISGPLVASAWKWSSRVASWAEQAAHCPRCQEPLAAPAFLAPSAAWEQPGSLPTGPQCG